MMTVAELIAKLQAFSPDAGVVAAAECCFMEFEIRQATDGTVVIDIDDWLERLEEERGPIAYYAWLEGLRPE